MVEAEFTCDGMKTIIQCIENQKMKDICKQFCDKSQKKFESTLFLLGGEKVDMEKEFKDMITNNSENPNKLTIFANDNSIQKEEYTIVNSKQVSCPLCEQKSIRFKLKNYHISLFECDKDAHKHKFLGINADEYLKTQKIKLTEIKCNKCNKNKSEIYQQMLYKCCKCKKLLCPLCKNYHDKSHKIFNYEDKFFICEKGKDLSGEKDGKDLIGEKDEKDLIEEKDGVLHGEYYTKYCNDCKTNICTICEKDHKSHHMTFFSDI